MQLLATLNPESVDLPTGENYPVREAARAVVLDSENRISLLHVTTEKYYKLPGGGIEAGENPFEALQRECSEEAGCEVTIFGEIGSIVEYRKFCTLKQVSYCYLARVKGEKGKPHFTEEELAEGFENVWLPYEKALAFVSNNQATSLEGREYIVPRDTIFLQAAKPLITP